MTAFFNLVPFRISPKRAPLPPDVGGGDTGEMGESGVGAFNGGGGGGGSAGGGVGGPVLEFS